MGKLRFLSVLLICALFGGLLAPLVPAYADSEAAARIGSTDYLTVTEALQSAQNGDCITILRDINEVVSYTVTPDLVITIDGNNKTINGVRTFDHDYSAAFTLRGSGTIKFKNLNMYDMDGAGADDSYGLYIIGNVNVFCDGTVKAQGGKITTGQSIGVYNCGTGTINISDAAGGEGVTGSVGAYNTGLGTINVTRAVGGAANVNSFGVYNSGSGTVNVGQSIGGNVNKDWTCGVNNSGAGTVNANSASGGTSDSEIAASCGVMNSGTGVVNVLSATGEDKPVSTGSAIVNTSADVIVLVLDRGIGNDCVLDSITVAKTGVTRVGGLPNVVRNSKYSSQWYTDSSRTNLVTDTSVSGVNKLYSIFSGDIHTISTVTSSYGAISCDKEIAKGNETVNLTITPIRGYKLKAGSLKYNDGTDHLITGTSFTMPAADVTVSAEYEQVCLKAYIRYGDVSLSGNQFSYFNEKGDMVIEKDITNDDVIMIIGDGNPVAHGISISQGAAVNTYNIILQNVNLDQSSKPATGAANAFAIFPYTTVNLQLDGNNFLKSGTHCAGLQVAKTSVVNFKSYLDNSGTLTATGGTFGAGIGSGNIKDNKVSYGDDSGTINLNYYTINAKGGLYSAGIGGGYGSNGGKVTIDGGTVKSAGSDGGAGIGGGEKGNGGVITINGGTITATRAKDPVQYGYKGIYGASIGGGFLGSGGTITINGGCIVTNSRSEYLDKSPGLEINDLAAGIGGGFGGARGNITINGGTITQEGYSLGAGIGSGSGSGLFPDDGTIVITGGKIIARSIDGAGIGGGGMEAISWSVSQLNPPKNSSPSNRIDMFDFPAADGGIIKISGGDIDAHSMAGAGIGGGYSGKYFGGNGAYLTISGGTVKASSSDSSGIGAGGYTDSYSMHGLKAGECKIDGGSVNVSSMESTVTNSDGKALYLSKVNVKGIPSSQEVSCSVDGRRFFNCAPDSEDNLYLWLPINASNRATDLLVRCEGTDRYYSSNITKGLNNFIEIYSGPTTTVAVISVSLNKPRVSIKAGNSEALTADVRPAFAANQNVVWSSDKPNTAAVDQTGKVTAWTVGTANITATTVDGKKTASCQVSVPLEKEVTPGGIVNIASTPVFVNVPANAGNAKLGIIPNAILPRIDVETKTAVGDVKITIPAGAAASGIAGWSGNIKLPTVITELGSTVLNGKANVIVEVGYDSEPVMFTKAVRLLIPGMAGHYAGYIRNGIFTPILKTISKDDEITADSEIPVNGEGKIDIGNDLVIWTKHFTSFVAYTPNATSSGGGGSSSSRSNNTTSGAVTVTPAAVNVTSSAIKQPEEKKNIVFTDMENSWAKSSVEKLVSMGAIGGYPDGSFKPNGKITRSEFVTMLVKALKLKNSGNAPMFNDTAKHWANENITIAASLGFMSGRGNSSFKPDSPITREEMAVVAVNAGKLSQTTGETSFSDNNKIASWAKGSVLAAVNAKIIHGYSDNTFKPQGNATRAEAVMIISSLIK